MIKGSLATLCLSAALLPALSAPVPQTTAISIWYPSALAPVTAQPYTLLGAGGGTTTLEVVLAIPSVVSGRTTQAGFSELVVADSTNLFIEDLAPSSVEVLVQCSINGTVGSCAELDGYRDPNNIFVATSNTVYTVTAPTTVFSVVRPTAAPTSAAGGGGGGGGGGTGTGTATSDPRPTGFKRYLAESYEDLERRARAVKMPIGFARGLDQAARAYRGQKRW